MEVTNYFLIGLRSLPQVKTHISHKYWGRVPVARQIMGSRDEPTTLIRLNNTVLNQLLATSHYTHRLEDFSSIISEDFIHSR